MIYKVYYQPTKKQNPKRENTLSLYVEAADLATARHAVESNTDFNLEHIEELSDAALTYEQQSLGDRFKLTEF
ncbi:DNA-dependent RNA polymerase auxiliary subunit epsilon family protein [Weissella diestrammenae]|uniref:DNA-directed RNA polymerase subunit epsilon n=1 Tax=Weissella diestrammenae TaxID=1162633 RepID=A0A7G9T5F4_9LACO|nr:DNA-directed RNA polymerase subunit epsilon [Weissella diestrammenae]MCM0583188.1 DNA-dependent RNA polymerase auxiliary subunit epsilon family protein [Weissella diestrammenae]QNN75329.1 DNA-dependent RNA polymerase auxiliary subunit epsilon family protein [Weissella diestrammenae]